MSLTLTYFPVRGRAEVIRVMLKDQGAEFDEKVITMEMWKESTLKASCLFGQLPIFEDGDLTLYQTNAIRRHLARKLGLYGKDQREAALIDMMDEAIQDLLNKYIKLMFEKDDSGKEGYLKALPTDLKPFEKTLSGNKGSFLVGDKISLADYALVILLIHHQVLSPPCLHAFPSLQSYLKRLCARPNLHAYFHSDDFKNRPIIPGKRT
ncbi:glutathione S-transferase P-like [Oncorhynchus keta]|uniref:glutathione S-transferase P-like n=1 Tax=Oncorhynchus keta TaxID=8018 RepID=UPI0015FDAF9B|nr:glutathione S-transferase P-like [Oncorhynchus keta]